MPNIRVDLDYTIRDGSEIKFRSPVDCSAITGLIVYYPGADGSTTSNVFALADAHGNNVGDIDHLFAENVVVKVILDVTSGMAFVQNADTNAYLEGRFRKLQEEVDQLEQQGVTDKSIAEAVDKYMEENPIALDDLGAAPAALGLGRAGGTLIAVNDSGDVPLQSLKLFGKTTQNGTPSPASPVPLVSAGDIGAIKTTVCGGNLLPYPYKSTSATSGGLTYTVQSDGGIKVSGTKTATTYFNLLGAIGDDYQTEKIRFTKPVYVLLENGFSISARLTDGTYTEISGDKALNKPIGALYVNCSAAVNTAINTVLYPMISYVNSTEYEPYKGQTLTASTPNGLPGIPVSEGGNYTDENGQQWICDEIDFARGVYVQRIGKYTFTGEEAKGVYGSVNANGYGRMQISFGGAEPAYISNENKVPSFCDKYLPMGATELAYHIAPGGTGYYFAFLANRQMAFSTKNTTSAAFKAEITGTSVFYQLATPIETALSADELSAFAALHTNKPNTTVYTDAGAYMEVEYATELSALPISGGRMGGKLGMAGNRITDVGDPVADSDAVNKAYVDGLVGSGNDLVEDSEHPGCYYRLVNGVKEWLNPPGVVGVAYCTTERYKGYPVWVKTVYVGDGTANTTASVAYLNEDEYPNSFAEPIRACANTMSGEYLITQTLPGAVAYADDGSFAYYVEVTPTFDVADVYATVWYIRED